MATQTSSDTYPPSTSGIQGGMTGRITRKMPRNFWPDHDMRPRTDFVNERNRVASMWKI
jgi:hypothetical protein